MIHKACMPVYMNSGKIVAGRDGWTGGESKVLQEVLADLKTGGGPITLANTASSLSLELSHLDGMIQLE